MHNVFIPCIRLYTGKDLNSHFEEGLLELKMGARGDFLSGDIPAVKTSFQETSVGGSLSWHTAPVRQLLITLSGRIDFETKEGLHFELSKEKILLAEDTTGSGHAWKLIGHEPWRRVYIVLASGAKVPFMPNK
jgi:hypothetical protein